MKAKKIIPLFFLVLIWLIFSSPFLIKNLIPAPLDFLVGFFNPWQAFYKIPIRNNALPDVVTQIIPFRLFNLSQIEDFKLPFWNPYNFSGTPHLANIQSAVFYPLNLSFLLPFHLGHSLFILIQPLLAGIFTYLFCREIKLKRLASLLSSFSFMFSGFITSWLEYGTLVHAFLWLPLCFFLIEKIKKRKHFSFWHLTLILSLATSLLAGHLQISLYLVFVSLFYLLVWILKNETPKKPQLINLIITFVAPFLLISFQFLPSLKLYSNSLRSQAISSGWYHFFQTPPSHLITLLAPDFFGNPVTRNFWSKGSYVEMMGYIGLIPLILAAFASFQTKKYQFFKVLSFVSLLFALPTPFSNLVLKLKIPIFATSSPSRIFCLFCFSTSILAGIGLETIKKENLNRLLKTLAIFSCLFLALWFWTIFSKENPQNLRVTQRNLLLPTFLLFTTFVAAIIVKKNPFKIDFKILASFFLVLILILSTFDLFRFSFKFTSYTKKDLLFPNLGVIKFAQKNQGIHRTFALFDAQQNLPFEIFSPEGYDPLSIRRYQELISTSKTGKISLTERTAGESLDRRGKYTKRLLDLFGVKFVVQGKSDAFAFPTWDYPQSFEKMYEDKNFFIFENKNVPPRFFLTNKIIVKNNDLEVINTLLNENFTSSEIVILEEEPKLKKSENLLDSSIKLLNYQPNQVSLTTESNQEAILYLSDSFYSNWQAFIDNKKTKIYRANYAFRAVTVPSGSHVVRFEYCPQEFLLGLKISLFTLIILLFLIFKKRLKIFTSPFDIYIRHKIIANLLGKKKSVLDVGGGLGQLKKFSPNKITTADIQNADIILRGEKLPFKNSQFDIVTSIDTLEHIPQENRKFFVNELVRVAKEKVILATPIGTKKHQLHEENLLKKLKDKTPHYLKEHVKYGLPTLKSIKNLTKGKKTKLFFSGDFRLSEKLLKLHLYELKNKPLNKILYYLKMIINLLLNLTLYPILKKRKYNQNANRFYLIIKKY